MRVRQPAIQYDGRQLVDGHGAHKPLRVVLHSTESHDTKGIDDLAGIAKFWHGQGRGYGAHIGIDAEGNSARYVDDGEIAWHVANRNTGSLGIEQVGFAASSRKTWKRRPRQLHKVARWLAYWSKAHDIPLKKDAEHGISTHDMQSKKYGGTHWDPGPGYPLWLVLQMAKIYRQLGW